MPYQSEHTSVDFPEGPAISTLPSKVGGAGSIPDWWAKIPYALQLKHQNIKQKQWCNKFNVCMWG